MNFKHAIILSGGMDSVTLLHDIVKQFGNANVAAVTFNYGQKHRLELNFAKENCEILEVYHKIIEVPALGVVAPSALTSDIPMPTGEYNCEDMKKTVVPNRNMVLLSFAASFALGVGASYLYYGAHSGDHDIYPDCRPEFVELLKKAFAICDWNPLILDVPYLYHTKGDIVKRGLELGVDYSKTLTCYNGTIPACGVCGSCDERLKAFAENAEIDPLEYVK